MVAELSTERLQNVKLLSQIQISCKKSKIPYFRITFNLIINKLYSDWFGGVIKRYKKKATLDDFKTHAILEDPKLWIDRKYDNEKSAEF